MNIFRCADEKAVPSWFEKEDEVENTNAPVEQVESINIAEEVNDQVLAEECDRIEVCSSNGKDYHYNSNWDAGTVSHLREYAIACGMDIAKFRGFDPSVLTKESKQKDPIVKTANTAIAENVQALKGVWTDPFHIEERSDMSHMEPNGWEAVKKQAVLGKPSIDLGGVFAIGGGEDYNTNSDVNPAINQNSITNPLAIEQLAESEEDDTGVRLHKEQEAKAAQKKANHGEWEQEKIAEMSQGDIIPKGSVFPTETLNANTGLNNPSSQYGVYAKFDINAIPDLTAGENIAERNKQYKESIQRPKQEDDWQKPCKQTSMSISDSFGTELEALLKK